MLPSEAAVSSFFAPAIRFFNYIAHKVERAVGTLSPDGGGVDGIASLRHCEERSDAAIQEAKTPTYA
jgi:hypothetical protein